MGTDEAIKASENAIDGRADGPWDSRPGRHGCYPRLCPHIKPFQEAGHGDHKDRVAISFFTPTKALMKVKVGAINLLTIALERQM